MTDIREKAHFGFIHLMLLDYSISRFCWLRLRMLNTFHFQEEENDNTLLEVGYSLYMPERTTKRR